jgi:predicted branched-subunit amino acid permease
MATAAALGKHPEFLRGARNVSSVAPGIAAWGLVTGVAMIKSGLSLPLAIFMSLVVFAGSAQLAALPLVASGAPMWVIWATAACVNLRFVIFSAQWRPYWQHCSRRSRLFLVYLTADLSYALFMRRFPKPEPAPEQLPYVWGGVAVNWSSWQLASIAGMLLAHQVPPHWGLGFAGVLALLGFTCSLLVDRATWGAAIAAAWASVASYDLPLKLNIVVAIAVAIAVGLLIDHRTLREAAPADDAT